jgi:DNA-binding PadR family transcriptional regulator
MLDYVSYVEILILRSLTRYPAHGYELRKRVEAVTGVVLNNNSLYPALRRFEEAGAVTRTAHEQQGRPAKLVYELTEIGHELLHDLLADLPPEVAQDDTEFMTRLGQFSFLSAQERLAVLDARDDALAERHERISALRQRSGDEQWSTLVTEDLLRRTEQERQWLAGLRVLAAQDQAVPDEAVPDEAVPGQEVPAGHQDGAARAGP